MEHDQHSDSSQSQENNLRQIDRSHNVLWVNLGIYVYFYFYYFSILLCAVDWEVFFKIFMADGLSGGYISTAEGSLSHSLKAVRLQWVSALWLNGNMDTMISV